MGFCCVVGCANNALRDPVKFYCIPTATNHRFLTEKNALTAERRKLWLLAIRRADLNEDTPKKVKNARVCSAHFISGKPAHLKDRNNPDWVPCQNMGYGMGPHLWKISKIYRKGLIACPNESKQADYVALPSESNQNTKRRRKKNKIIAAMSEGEEEAIVMEITEVKTEPVCYFEGETPAPGPSNNNHNTNSQTAVSSEEYDESDITWGVSTSENEEEMETWAGVLEQQTGVSTSEDEEQIETRTVQPEQPTDASTSEDEGQMETRTVQPKQPKLSQCNCILEHFFALKPFSARSLAEKKEIIAAGRPTPELQMLNKISGRQQLYIQYPWLTGCAKWKSLFCWPCMIFSTAADGAFRVTDSANFINRSRSHVLKEEHKLCEGKLLRFREKPPNGMLRQNEVVQRRYLIARLIDSICYVGRPEYATRNADKSADDNADSHRDSLCSLIEGMDGILRKQLEVSSPFNYSLPIIEKDLIQAIATVTTRKVKEDIASCHFVSLILEEIGGNLLKVAFTYFCDEPNTVVVGTFDSTSDEYLKRIPDILKDYQCEDKLVSYTFYCSSQQKFRLLEWFRKNYPKALFVHCYSLKLDLVLQNSDDFNKIFCDFVDSCSALRALFTQASASSPELKEACECIFPGVDSKNWVLSPRLVQTLSEKTNGLRRVVQQMADRKNPCALGIASRVMAEGLLRRLDDTDFQFCLQILPLILPRAEEQYNQLKKRVSDPAKYKEHIEKFLEPSPANGNMFDGLMLRVADLWEPSTYTTPQAPKRKRLTEGVRSESFYRSLHLEIIKNFSKNLTARARDIQNLKFLALVEPKKFPCHAQNFPTLELNFLLKLYPVFDRDLLEVELRVLYRHWFCSQKCQTIDELWQYLKTSGLSDVWSEAFKLACLCVTIPATNAPVDTSFSPNSVSKGSNSLDYTTIDKLMRNSRAFYDMVIEEFVQKKPKGFLG